jgi:hypothetical protein
VPGTVPWTWLSRRRSRRNPRTTRYAAPAHFTTVNAVADETTIDEMPTAAASTWTSPPAAMPNAETTPPTRPRSIPWATMYSTAGPGTTMRASAAAAKSASVDGSGMARP